MIKYDNVMMATAHEWSKESYCIRRKVGVVIGKDGRIIATGYNGTIPGENNMCEDEFIMFDKKPYPFKDFKITNRNIESLRETVNSYDVKSTGTMNMNIGFVNTIVVELTDSIRTVAYSIKYMDFLKLKDALENNNADTLLDFFKPYIKKYIVTKTNDLTLHAEQNILMFCAKHGIGINGCTMYITTSPCKQCSKLIASSGIKRVVYSEEYRDTEGIDFLKKLGITVDEYNT